MRAVLLATVLLSACATEPGFHRECLISVGCRCIESETVRDQHDMPIPDGIPIAKRHSASGATWYDYFPE